MLGLLATVYGGGSVVPDARTVGGAAVGGAVVAGGCTVRNKVVSRRQERERTQYMVIVSLLQRNMDGICTEESLKGLMETRDSLHTACPAFPQLKLAFDVLRSYQAVRGPSIGCCCVSRGRAEADPRTVAIELVKAWLRENIENTDLHPGEVCAYRNFCRSFLAHEDQFQQHLVGRQLSFIQVMSHVAQHLDSLLRLRLQHTRSCAIHLTHLRTEAYNFMLHATKLLLLAPTGFKLPPQMYSTDSLGLLRRTSLQPYSLDTELERQLADRMQATWGTDSGRLVKRLLSSPHLVRICESVEGAPENRPSSTPLRIVVRSAENLPNLRWMDTVDPYVAVTLRQLGKSGDPETVCSFKTRVIKNEPNPVWEHVFEFEVPDGDDASLLFAVHDYNEMTAGAFHNVVFAEAPVISVKQALKYAGEGRELRVRLDSANGFLANRPDALSKAGLVVRFELPNIEHETNLVRQMWNAGQIKNSGLLDASLSEQFLSAAKDLDNLTYFCDILVSQCLEVAHMLGDLGMVFCASAIRPLLDEVEQRVIKAEAAIGRELIDQVYKTKVDAALSQKWFHARAGSSESDELVEESIGKLRSLKGRILCTVAELRHTCDSYDGVGGVLREAQAKVKALLERLGQSDTKKRSDRFQGMLVDLEQKAEPAWQPASGNPSLLDGEQGPEATLQLALGPLGQAVTDSPVRANGLRRQLSAITKEQESAWVSWEPQPQTFDMMDQMSATAAQAKDAPLSAVDNQTLSLIHPVKSTEADNPSLHDYESTTASGPPSHDGSIVGNEDDSWHWAPRFAQAVGIWRGAKCLHR